jgi:hypothetical protein
LGPIGVICADLKEKREIERRRRIRRIDKKGKKKKKKRDWERVNTQPFAIKSSIIEHNTILITRGIAIFVVSCSPSYEMLRVQY